MLRINIILFALFFACISSIQIVSAQSNQVYNRKLENQKLISTLHQTSNDSIKLNILDRLMSLSNFDSISYKRLATYKQLASKLQNQTHITHALRYDALFNLNYGNYNLAENNINIAIKRYKKSNDTPYLLKTYIIKARLFDVQFNKDSAVYYYNLASKLANTPNELFITQYRMGVHFLNTEKYKKATKLLIKAQDQAVKMKDSIKIAMVLYRLWVFNHLEKQSHTTTKELEKSLKILKKYYAKENEIANNLFVLGNALVKEKEYAKSLDNYNQAIQLYKRNGASLSIGFTYSAIAGAYTQLKKKRMANKYLDSAITKFNDVHNLNYLANAYNRKGILAFNNNDIPKATKNMERSLDLYKKIKLHKRIYIAYHNLSYLYEDIGQHKKAYNYLMKAFKYKDTVLKNDYLKDLAEIKTKYQTQQKEAQILKLSNENIKKEAALAKTRFTMYAIGGTSVFLLGLGLLFWQRRRQQQKLEVLASAVKASETEKQRIGKELHDGVAGSLIKLVYETEGDNLDLSDKLLKTYNEIRTLSHQLNNTPMHDEVFADRIMELLPKNLSGKQFKIHIEPRNLKLPEPYGTHLYRIIQELIANNLKYAQATETEINMVQKEDILHFEYKDNGVGIADLKQGNGLKNIADRVSLMKGKVQINSASGNGFSLIFSLHNIPTIIKTTQNNETGNYKYSYN